MKKAFRHLLATLLALAMVCALAAPVFADGPADHTFKAYQIFTGDVAELNGQTVLSNVEWNVKDINVTYFLNLLSTDKTLGSDFNTQMDAAKVAGKIKEYTNSPEKAIAVARCAYNSRTLSAGAPMTSSSFTAASDGYYLLVDESPNGITISSAGNFSVLTLCKAGISVTLATKYVNPTVAITVEDNDSGVNSFGSSADHATNESFKFKMTAKLPKSDAYKYYYEYGLSFEHTLASTIQFEGNDSNIADDVNVTITCGSDKKDLQKGTDYSIFFPTAESDKYDISIHNVKNHFSADELEANGATIDVTYKAHLKNTAAVTTDGTKLTTNTGSVYLIFPDNPHKHGDYCGQTATSTAYVYTYGVTIKKVGDNENGRPLLGATFRLYSKQTCAENEEIYLKSAAPLGGNNEYLIADSTTTTGVDLVTPSDGLININGLDAGTYYLKEIKAPDGYNTLTEPVTLTIAAEHTETSIKVGLGTVDSGTMTKIVINNSGVVLPSTGGMGTTIFYVVGGLLMVGAAVLLVTKKRMQKN